MKFGFRHVLLVLAIILALVSVHYYFTEYMPAVEDDRVPHPSKFLPFEFYENYFSGL
jgi:hypothetical protein